MSIEEEIDSLLYYRNIIPLRVLIKDEHIRLDIINYYKLIRHKLGEPINTWLRLIFGEVPKIKS